jgi:protein-L-isoaspartate(D-aspartate) O-methyltransferase
MNLDLARRQMVEQQVRCWDVSDVSVLDVLDAVARDQFVPAEYRHLAYADTGIPLAAGQHMMTPIVEGRLLQSLHPNPSHTALEIGTGSGFLTACLAKLAGTVVSVDIHAELLAMAEANLATAAIENVTLQEMDATDTLPSGTFDLVAVTASMPVFDRRYLQILKPGGRLFVIVGDPPIMEAGIVTLAGDGDWQYDTEFETLVAPLENSAKTPRFAF